MTIIFMYKGKACNYLVYTLRCAVLASPNHRVISISDQRIKMDGVENYDWDEYADGTKEFEELPGFPEEDVFHRRSFVRPAILKRFCSQHGIDRFFNADADVLVMDDLDVVMEPFKDCDFTMSICSKARGKLTGLDGLQTIGHTNHSLMSLKTITEYMDFAKWFAAEAPESIGCDMMCWSAFKEFTSLKWADTFDTLDHHIGDAFDKYHNINGHKYIEWFRGRPHKSRLADGGLEPLPIIHCWSETKAFIPEWFRKFEATAHERKS